MTSLRPDILEGVRLITDVRIARYPNCNKVDKERRDKKDTVVAGYPKSGEIDKEWTYSEYYGAGKGGGGGTGYSRWITYGYAVFLFLFFQIP